MYDKFILMQKNNRAKFNNARNKYNF